MTIRTTSKELYSGSTGNSESGYTTPGTGTGSSTGGSRGSRGDVYTDGSTTGTGSTTGSDWLPKPLIPPVLPSDTRQNIIARINAYPGIESALKTDLQNASSEVVSMEDLNFLLEMLSTTGKYYKGEKSETSFNNEVLRNILTGKSIEDSIKAAYASMDENPYITTEQEAIIKEAINNVKTQSTTANTSNFYGLVIIAVIIFFVSKK